MRLSDRSSRLTLNLGKHFSRLVRHGLLLCVGLAAGADADETLFTGGAIFTATDTTAEAVLIRDGKIIAVGDESSVAELATANAERVDIGSGLLAPGFVDSHVHPVGVGLALTIQCDLSGIGNRERILKRVAGCAKERKGQKWLIGRGWALGAFAESRPSAADLDGVLPEGMAGYFTAEDGHNAWASTAAFERAGVDASTPDPEGGHVERLEDGRPQGTLRERAMDLFADVLPGISSEQEEDALIAALKLFNRYGITTVVSAGVDGERVGQYQRVLERGELSARMIAALWVDPDWNQDMDELAALYSSGDSMLRVTQIKLMLDGVMENQTAHLSFAYPGLAHHGTVFFEDEAELTRWATALEELGYQLHFHTVGDAAIAQGLRVLNASRMARNAPNNRPVFAHDYVIADKDLPALREAGAFMQMTMLWDQQNDSMVNLNKPFLSAEQYAELMPAEKLIAANVPVIGGSDAPVGQANPLASIQVAVTGQGVPYFDGGDMELQAPMPGGRVPLAAMLRAYTIEAARALDMDDFTGSIEVGKSADLILLDRDLFAVPPDSLYGTKVRMTLLEGRRVYDSSARE